jgi:hypothetical protein
VRVFPGERVGKLDPTSSARDITLMLGADGFEMTSEALLDRRGQDGDAILVALGFPDQDLIVPDITGSSVGRVRAS